MPGVVCNSECPLYVYGVVERQKTAGSDFNHSRRWLAQHRWGTEKVADKMPYSYLFWLALTPYSKKMPNCPWSVNTTAPHLLSFFAVVESLFSIISDVLKSKRLFLTAENLEKLVFTKGVGFTGFYLDLLRGEKWLSQILK